MSNKDYQPETIDDVEAEDELFGEVIEQSDAHIEDVNVMAASDLSEASSPATGSTIHLPNRKTKHSGIEEEDRPHLDEGQRASNASGVGITIALAVLVIGGLYVLTMGGDEPASTTDKPAATKTVDDDGEETVATPSTDTIEQVPEDSDENPNSDGTPTLDAETLIKGMVAAGWRTGNRETTKLPEVTQTYLLAQKDKMAATVTIYESRTWEHAQKTVLETEPPSKTVSFGRTIARISLASKDHQNGIVEMTDALTEFKKAAKEKAAAEAP